MSSDLESMWKDRGGREAPGRRVGVQVEDSEEGRWSLTPTPEAAPATLYISCGPPGESGPHLSPAPFALGVAS